MDVIQNYTTYKRFCALLKQIEHDPEVPHRQGRTRPDALPGDSSCQYRAGRFHHRRALSALCAARTRRAGAGHGGHRLPSGRFTRVFSGRESAGVSGSADPPRAWPGQARLGRL